MEALESALHELHELEDRAGGATLLHRLHPLAKLGGILLAMVVATSFPVDAAGAQAMMLLLAGGLLRLGRLSLGQCLRRLRMVLPVVLLVGIANPFLDRAIVYQVGPVEISRGMVSMLTLAMKGVFCLGVSYALMATTRMSPLCAALQRVGVPEALTTLLLLTHRYLTVLLREASLMRDAYRLRAAGARGVHVSAWGTFLGQLLLRSMDRAQALHQAMELRGFRGAFPVAESPRWRLADTGFVGATMGVLGAVVWIARVIG